MSNIRITIEVPEENAGPVMAQFIRQGASIQAVGLVEDVPFHKNKPRTKKRTGKGNTERVLNWLTSGAATPIEIAEALHLENRPVHSVLNNLVKSKKVSKLKDGKYQLKGTK